ncbi:nucleotidyl transferase AbiEii/AbiGii toxin family protein [Luteolibacter soli]|uniref:Nucleotidyl transferase AbiEii/AbiGii toxin family protein n=1 Tax=Luteolibacter soli TaxID=3135280 RepID=A0ABU9ATZ2_9BACT
MKLQKDIHEFVALLLSRKVEFLLVGGYALAFHGAPRFTEDIDLFVFVSPENASKMAGVIEEFGFGELGLSTADFLVPDQVIQLGRAPHRIDLLTGISGVTWEMACESRIEVELDDLKVFVIGKAALEANKAATGRPQDLADLARLRGRA